MPPRRRSRTSVERAVLSNGLRIVAAPDASSPLVGLAVAYDVGFRSEPEGRTGFAHLFEHLMFQGSANVAKMEHVQLVQSAGGMVNGHTRADLTAYYEILPSAALELGLFLEADRMRSIALNEENLRNQVAVVEEEIKVNVLNQPYGGFPWLMLPELAFDSYPNAHNGYGDFAHLESATLEDAAGFFATYYAPSNAVLVVAGDCEPAEVVSLAERHFGDIPARPVPPHGPWPEPPLRRDRRRRLEDPRAPHPAFAAGYRTPDPVNRLDDYAAYAVLGSVLTDGDASRLRQRLIHHDHSVTDVSCMIGTFGDGTFMRDPALFQIIVFHPGSSDTHSLLLALDEELRRVADEGPSTEELRRVAAVNSASYWRGLDSTLERALALASLEVIHGRAELLDELPERLAAVTEDQVAAAARALFGQHRAVVEVAPAGERR